MRHSLKGATVLVTGGAGTVGSHLVDALVDAGAREIRVLDNLVRGRLENLREAMERGPVRFIEGDIRDRELVKNVVAGCDYVFHQAALRITLCADRPRECVDVLVTGTLNIFEQCVAAKVKKVVYASSASVYGMAQAFPTPETHHPYGNRTLYGAAKLMNEGLARHFWDMNGLPSVGLRYFNVYGPRMDVTGAYTEVFIRWLECIEEKRRPQIHGDGSATMDFIYVGDVARANILALESEAQDTVFNIASGTETSLLQLWNAIGRVNGVEGLAPEFHPPRKVNGVVRRLADTQRATRELGFKPVVNLDEGLRRLSAWWRQAVACEAGETR